MLLGVSPVRRSLSYVRTTAHRKQTAVTSHPKEITIVKTLTNECLGEHDVVHVLT